MIHGSHRSRPSGRFHRYAAFSNKLCLNRMLCLASSGDSGGRRGRELVSAVSDELLNVHARTQSHDVYAPRRQEAAACLLALVSPAASL